MNRLINTKFSEQINDTNNYLFNSENLVFLETYKNELFNKIDIISIDPPYNTGKKMGKYNDNFKSINSWLEFMEIRIKLSRDFLSERGLIFININEKNSPYLRILCDQIFGIENHVSTIIWQNKYSVSNDKSGITCQTENILLYAKDIQNIKINNDELLEEYVTKTYKNWDNDPRGFWRKGVLLYKNKNKVTYTVTSPTGKKWTKGWNYKESEWYDTLVKQDLIYWGDDGNLCPVKKTFLNNSKGRAIRNLWLGDEVGYTQDGTSDIEKILKKDTEFLYPKPIKLYKKILKIASKEDSIVMDYFAGSGTLGQAVYEYNREYNTKLNFILVTNNENNICEDITINRLKLSLIENEGFNYIS